jgi:hypothetical protein
MVSPQSFGATRREHAEFSSDAERIQAELEFALGRTFKPGC